MTVAGWRESEDERMLRHSVALIAQRAQPIAALRRARDAGEPGGHTPGLWPELLGSGFAMPYVSEAEGGVGLGYAAAGIVAEALGRSLAQTPMITMAMAMALTEAAPDSQRRDWMARCIGGGTIAVALDEGGRHDPGAIMADVDRDGQLSGVKTAVVDGVTAESFLIVAQAGGEVAVVAIPRIAPRVSVEPLAWIDRSDSARVRFSGVPCALVARGEAAAAAIDRACDIGRALLAAELLGLASEAFDRTVAYLKQREQFGRKIGSFQALQHRAARLFVELEMTRGVVCKALLALDASSEDASDLCSLAKWKATRTARAVMVEAVQMHGGIGVTDALDIGLFVKRARVLQEVLGDDAFHGRRLARRRWPTLSPA